MIDKFLVGPAAVRPPGAPNAVIDPTAKDAGGAAASRAGADLKALAADAVPKIEMHVQMAAELQSGHRTG